MSVTTEKNKTFISIDLCRDYSQVAYCLTNSMSEPESVSVIPGEEKFLVPTVAGKLNASNEWVIGDDAYLRNKNGEAELSGDIIMAILAEKKIVVADQEYSGFEVLKEFIYGLLKLANNNYKIPRPDKIVVTVEYPDRILVNLIRNVLENLEFEKDNIKVIGHSESLIYYMIFQKRDLWVNDVFIFDFTENQFMIRRLNTIRARMPQPIVVEEMDMSSKFSMGLLKTEEGKKQMDEDFLELLKELCGKYIVSTVYLTGVGFYEKWMEESVRFLCSKRRVFQGHNLFVKGACYAGISEAGLGRAEEYQFVCSGRTLVNIDLEIEKGEKNVPITLSKAGTNWYEAGARAEAILDGTSEIVFDINSSVSKMSKKVSMRLNSFPIRPNRTTRVEIILAYRNDSQCVVVVKDLGFGELFKSSGEIVREIINVEEFI